MDATTPTEDPAGQPPPGGTPDPADKGGFVQRLLNGIEAVGNKVPHPAIIFLGLCGLVVVLSAILSAFDVAVTYDVVEPPPMVVEEQYQTGSVVPGVAPQLEDYLGQDLEVHQETTSIRSLLGGDGVRFEPRAALTPGGDGLSALATLIDGAPAHLSSGGWLLLEHGTAQGVALRERLVARGFTHVTSHRDLAGHERVTEGKWP